MKVLILGAGGLTGRYLVREAKRRGMEVAPFTRQELDITQPDVAREMLAKVKPDVVINAASVTSLETCEENPTSSRKVNCEAPEEWAKECGRSGVRFVHLGTDYIFDGKKTSAYLPSDLHLRSPDTDGIRPRGKRKFCGPTPMRSLSGWRGSMGTGERHL